MADNRHESNLPRELAAPARRALLGAGCTRLEDVAKMSEAEVMALHGIGPNALKPPINEKNTTAPGMFMPPRITIGFTTLSTRPTTITPQSARNSAK